MRMVRMGALGWTGPFSAGKALTQSTNHGTCYNRVRARSSKQLFYGVYFVLLVLINVSAFTKISESSNSQEDRRGGVKSCLLPTFQLSGAFHGRKARIITLVIIFAICKITCQNYYIWIQWQWMRSMLTIIFSWGTSTIIIIIIIIIIISKNKWSFWFVPETVCPSTVFSSLISHLVMYNLKLSTF